MRRHWTHAQHREHGEAPPLAPTGTPWQRLPFAAFRVLFQARRRAPALRRGGVRQQPGDQCVIEMQFHKRFPFHVLA